MDKTTTIKNNLKSLAKSDPRTSGRRIDEHLRVNGKPGQSTRYIWGAKSNPTVTAIYRVLDAIGEITGNNYTLADLEAGEFLSDKK